MPIEIDSLEHSCDVVKTALVHFLSRVLISSDSATSLLALLVKTLLHVKLRSLPSPARKQKQTLLWLGVGIANEHGAIRDEGGHPLENEDESGRRLCEYWGTIFEARQEGPRHFPQAPDDINWTPDRAEFDDLLASKKDSAPGPDGIPYGVYRCAGGLGSKFLFNAYQAVLEGRNIPDCFAESRTVFVPKTSDTDDLGRIIRSLDALRPKTLCNCDCKLLTSAICRGLHWYTMQCVHPSQRCISTRQMTDNIFEIETTALAHVACAPQDSGVLFD